MRIISYKYAEVLHEVIQFFNSIVELRSNTPDCLHLKSSSALNSASIHAHSITRFNSLHSGRFNYIRFGSGKQLRSKIVFSVRVGFGTNWCFANNEFYALNIVGKVSVIL